MSIKKQKPVGYEATTIFNQTRNSDDSVIKTLFER